MTKPKRADKSPAQQEWERARDCTKDEMLHRDFKQRNMPIFTRIQNASLMPHYNRICKTPQHCMDPFNVSFYRWQSTIFDAAILSSMLWQRHPLHYRCLLRIETSSMSQFISVASVHAHLLCQISINQEISVHFTPFLHEFERHPRCCFTPHLRNCNFKAPSTISQSL